MIDAGKEDYKLLSVASCDPRYDEIHDLKDVPDFTKKEIKNFFENYKTLENVEVTVGEYHNKEEALELIQVCIHNYQKQETKIKL